MPTPEAETTFSPLNFIEHQRSVNREFHDTDAKSAEMLDACFTEQLKELGLFQRHHTVDETGETAGHFDYVDPRAVRVIIDAFITGKLPQPEGPGSFLFSERTALGRQSALDTAIERIKTHTTYDVTIDPDFYSELGDVSG